MAYQENASASAAQAYQAYVQPVGSLIDTLQRRVSDTVDLAAVEFRYAAVSALGMLMLVILASAAIIVAWGLIGAALMATLAAAGYPWAVIAMGVALLHIVAALICWQLLLRLSRNLSLPAFRAALSEKQAQR
jgi:uncharacterized membrane protein YqjE